MFPKSFPLKFISYEGILFGYLTFFYSNRTKRFSSHKFITFWVSSVCFMSLCQNSFLLKEMIIYYVTNYYSDLLVVFLIVSQDCFYQLHTLVFLCAIIFFRKRLIKWLNFGLQLGQYLTKEDWNMINKKLGFQILFRYIGAVQVSILYYVSFLETISAIQLTLSVISFNINLITVELFRTTYGYLIAILKRTTDDINFQDDSHLLALCLIDVHKSLGHVKKYLSKPIFVVFGLFFVGCICNVSNSNLN